MKIGLDLTALKEDMEDMAEQLVVLAVNEAPYDTKDMILSIKAGNFNESDLSIEVFIDPDQLGNHPRRKAGGKKRWNGMLYPELVHKGTKLMPARPFFEEALKKLKTGDMQIKFTITDNEWK